MTSITVIFGTLVAIMGAMNTTVDFKRNFLASLQQADLRYLWVAIVAILVAGFNVWLWWPTKKQNLVRIRGFIQDLQRNGKKVAKLRGHKKTNFINAYFIKKLPFMIERTFGDAARHEYCDEIGRHNIEDPESFLMAALNKTEKIVLVCLEKKQKSLEKMQNQIEQLRH